MRRASLNYLLTIGGYKREGLFGNRFRFGEYFKNDMLLFLGGGRSIFLVWQWMLLRESQSVARKRTYTAEDYPHN
jgi:hypothetical protein